MWTPRLGKTTLAPAIADVYGMNPAAGRSCDSLPQCEEVYVKWQDPVEINQSHSGCVGWRSFGLNQQAGGDNLLRHLWVREIPQLAHLLEQA